MMKKNKFVIFLALTTLIIFAFSCKKEKPLTNESKTGKVVLKFAHYVDGNPVKSDTMIYTNAAGNLYQVNDFRYFISDVQFHKSGGAVVDIKECSWAHYVDNAIPSTLTWSICDKLPVGTYDSISFRFGISNAKNLSHIFVNPPESNMAWPEMLGGGYHYMQLDGKWKDSINQIENFNTHLGIGRVISASDTTFTDNSFHVKLDNSGFTLSASTVPEIQIIMNIDSWYKTPYIYNLNHFGQTTMMNQAAMHTIAANGYDVFSVGYIH